MSPGVVWRPVGFPTSANAAGRPPPQRIGHAGGGLRQPEAGQIVERLAGGFPEPASRTRRPACCEKNRVPAERLVGQLLSEARVHLQKVTNGDECLLLDAAAFDHPVPI